MNRRNFVKTSGAGIASLFMPSFACSPAASQHAGASFGRTGVYEISALFVALPRTSGSLELVRGDGMVLDAVQVIPSNHTETAFVKARVTLKKGDRVDLTLRGASRMQFEWFQAGPVPEAVATEPYGVWARDKDQLRAAERARDEATRLDRTLYLGRDLWNGDFVAFSGDAGKVPFRDIDYGEAPIVPRGHYWEAQLIAEGRAKWLPKGGVETGCPLRST